MKILILPSFARSLVGALNINFDSIPWGKFKAENIGKVDLVLPDKDVKYLLDINKNMSSILGLMELNIDSCPTYTPTGRYIDTFITNLSTLTQVEDNSVIGYGMLHVTRFDDNLLILEFKHTLAQNIAAMDKTVTARLLNTLSEYLSVEDLFYLSMTKKQFKY